MEATPLKKDIITHFIDKDYTPYHASYISLPCITISLSVLSVCCPDYTALFGFFAGEASRVSVGITDRAQFPTLTAVLGPGSCAIGYPSKVEGASNEVVPVSTRVSEQRARWSKYLHAITHRTPGTSCTLPPRIRTTLCSCKLWPSPGIYAVTSLPLLSLTLATFRMAELGFLGFVVKIREQTPLTKGEPSSAGARFTGGRCGLRAPLATCRYVTWLMDELLKPRHSESIPTALEGEEKAGSREGPATTPAT